MGKQRRFDKDFCTGIFFLAAGVFLFFDVSKLDFPVYDSLGSKFFPQIICACAAFLGALLALTSFLKRKERGVIGEKPSFNFHDNWRRLAFVVLTICYFLALKWEVGFRLSSTVYMFMLMLILGERRLYGTLVKYAVFSIVVSFGTQYFFEKVLMLLLP